MELETSESQQPDLDLETPPSPSDIFIAPSISRGQILKGLSYSYFSPLPTILQQNSSAESSEPQKCVLGIDEAGRGPVLGPMVYATFYLPTELHESLLAEKYHFNDSKVLTPETRSSLMRTLCTTETDLYASCGWAAKLLSARDISADMLAPTPYNLNAQALDATVELISGVMERGVDLEHVYIDTVGQPEAYQRKLEKFFPGVRITVAKKADRDYPVVSAASVVAKVTRDAALEVCWEAYAEQPADGNAVEKEKDKGADKGWGSGYPSDARSINWLKANMDPIFGWGTETRFSWGPAKDMLEGKGAPAGADWPVDDDEDTMKMTDFLVSRGEGSNQRDELANWYGTQVTEEIF
ncbi:ribonuclease HI large subunit [Rhizodiscina lignyota]|uniref:Ribonuclease n=1 Tax=Rhizodiscina lignyota TaxID=1504668 RepID=A0A9P4IFM0_9PEZI|nr:ribonuclease HI large subunit [Rhizodiscina lignyota]